MSSQSITLGINEGGRVFHGGKVMCPDCISGNTTSLSTLPQTQGLKFEVSNLGTVKEKDLIIRRQRNKGQWLYLLPCVNFGWEKKNNPPWLNKKLLLICISSFQVFQEFQLTKETDINRKFSKIENTFPNIFQNSLKTKCLSLILKTKTCYFEGLNNLPEVSQLLSGHIRFLKKTDSQPQDI